MSNFWATEYSNDPNPNCNGCKRLLKERERLYKIVEAVAHIGVDFGYGAFELSEEHIKEARDIIESVGEIK